jgi:hypothetical protein
MRNKLFSILPRVSILSSFIFTSQKASASLSGSPVNVAPGYAPIAVLKAALKYTGLEIRPLQEHQPCLALKLGGFNDY